MLAPRQLAERPDPFRFPGGIAAEFAGQERRWVRAVQVLEYIGLAEAVKLLQSLADDQPQSLLGRQAKASLKRLTSKSLY